MPSCYCIKGINGNNAIFSRIYNTQQVSEIKIWVISLKSKYMTIVVSAD